MPGGVAGAQSFMIAPYADFGRAPAIRGRRCIHARSPWPAPEADSAVFVTKYRVRFRVYRRPVVRAQLSGLELLRCPRFGIRSMRPVFDRIPSTRKRKILGGQRFPCFRRELCHVVLMVEIHAPALLMQIRCHTWRKVRYAPSWAGAGVRRWRMATGFQRNDMPGRTNLPCATARSKRSP